MNRRTIIGLLLAALLVAGCTGSSIGAGGKPKSKAYGNIISLSPSTTEIIAGVGGTTFLAGRTSACDRPATVSSIDVVVENTKPDYEKIMGLDPDLIVYDKSLYSDDEIAKMEQLGVETMEYSPQNIEEYKDFLYRLGAKLSVEMYVSRYVDRFESELRLAGTMPTTNPRAIILLGNPEQGYLAMGAGTLMADVMTRCGGTPVGPAGTLYQPVKIEALIDMDPEIIYSDENAQAVYADPRLQGIAAVKNQRVYEVDGKTMVRIGSSMEDIVKRFAGDFSRMPVNPRRGQGQ